jgi:hypothetical protein
VDSRVFPLILQAHKFLIVIHNTIITLFLVPLNERESRGRGKRTVIFVRLTAQVFVCDVASPTGYDSRLPTQFPTRTDYRKTPVENLLLFRYPSLSNPRFIQFNPTMTNTYTLTHNQPHVPNILLHVACLKGTKYGYVVDAVRGLLSTLGDVQLPNIHHHSQCNEVFYVHIWLVKIELPRFNQVLDGSSFKATQK